MNELPRNARSYRHKFPYMHSYRNANRSYSAFRAKSAGHTGRTVHTRGFTTTRTAPTHPGEADLCIREALEKQ